MLNPKIQSFLLVLPLAATLSSGCSTVPPELENPDGIPHQEAVHGFRVWVNDQVDLAQFNIALIPPPTSNVKLPEEPEEKEQFRRLMELLRTEIRSELLAQNLFESVHLDEGPATETGNILRLSTEVIEYYPGNPALRFTVGFGAGWPTMMLKGKAEVPSTDEPAFRFIVKRGFEPRPFEYDDETILRHNTEDMAKDLVEVISRIKNNQPLK